MRTIIIIVVLHWGGYQRDEGQEGDLRLLGETLLRNRETRQGERRRM